MQAGLASHYDPPFTAGPVAAASGVRAWARAVADRKRVVPRAQAVQG